MSFSFAYILSQILTVVEYGLLGLSYLAKSRKLVVILDIASMATGIVVYLLLGADLGLAMSVVILLANFYYLWDESSKRSTSLKSVGTPSQDKESSLVRSSTLPSSSSSIASSQGSYTLKAEALDSAGTPSQELGRKYKTRDYVVLVVVLGAIAVLSFLTYDGPASLLSVAATALYEVSIWQKSTKVYKFLGIPVAFCWMTYNGFVQSIFGVICELVMFITSIVGYIIEVRGGKKKAE